MRSKVLTVTSVVLLLALGLTGGWWLKSRSVAREGNAAKRIGTQFLTYVQEKNSDQAYLLTTTDYRTAVPRNEFDADTAKLSSSDLDPGLSMIYKSKNSYLLVQNYVDKDGKTAKVLTVTLYNDGKKIEISGFSIM